MYLLFIIKEVNVTNGARSLTSGYPAGNSYLRFLLPSIYIYIYGLVYLLALTSLCSLPSPPLSLCCIEPSPSVFGACSLAGIIRIWIKRHHLILGKCWVLFILLYVCYSLPVYHG